MHSLAYPPQRRLVRLALYGLISMIWGGAAGASPTAPQGPCEPYWEPTFGGSNGLNRAVECLTKFDFGSGEEVVAGGQFTEAGGALVSGVARWNGSEWLSIGDGLRTDLGDGTTRAPRVNALQSFDDGSGPALYAGGIFTHAGSVSSPQIARWDGSTWTTAGTNNFFAVTALTVFDDGSGAKLYAAAIEQTTLARDVYCLEGGVWTSIGFGSPSAANNLRTMTSYDDGTGPRLFVGGIFSTVAGQLADGLASWNGNDWVGYKDSLLTDDVYALQTFDPGTGPELYLGLFVPPSFTTSPVLRFDGSVFNEVGTNLVSAVSGISLPLRVSTLEVRSDTSGDTLYAGGLFSLAGETNAINVARWSGSDWVSVGAVSPTPSDSSLLGVRGIQFYGDANSHPEQLIAAGGFNSQGGVRARSAAAWDGASWSATSPGTDGSVFALTTRNEGGAEVVYAGGAFSMISGTSASNVASWNGVEWSALGLGANGLVQALVEFDDGSGSAIYAGGRFTMMGGTPAVGVARWDGVNWQPLSLASNSLSSVRVLTVHDDGTGPALYAGGDLTLPGTLESTGVARWNGTTWERLGTGLAIGGSILDMESADLGNGPRLFASGNGSVDSWDGTTWTEYSVFGVGIIYALEAFGTVPALYAGGLFSLGAGAVGNELLRFDGTTWSQVGPGSIGTEGFDGVYELGTYDDGTGPALIIGGRFSSPGVEPVYGIAKLSGNDLEPLAGGVAGLVRAVTPFENSLIVGGESDLLARDSGDSRIARVGCAADFLAVEFCASGMPDTSGCGACPCGNEAAGIGGCLNSQGGSAHLSASGSTSVLTDDLELRLSDATTSTFALLVSGADALPIAGPCPSGSGVIGLGLLDGTRCVGGPGGTRRHGARATSSTGSVTQPWGSLSGSWMASVGLEAGVTRSFQVFYRDDLAAGCGTGRNTSNAVRITAVP